MANRTGSFIVAISLCRDEDETRPFPFSSSAHTPGILPFPRSHTLQLCPQPLSHPSSCPCTLASSPPTSPRIRIYIVIPIRPSAYTDTCIVISKNTGIENVCTYLRSFHPIVRHWQPEEGRAQQVTEVEVGDATMKLGRRKGLRRLVRVVKRTPRTRVLSRQGGAREYGTPSSSSSNLPGPTTPRLRPSLQPSLSFLDAYKASPPRPPSSGFSPTCLLSLPLCPDLRLPAPTPTTPSSSVRVRVQVTPLTCFAADPSSSPPILPLHIQIQIQMDLRTLSLPLHAMRPRRGERW
ncbi:hypothetical protein R3P38DRAFT_1730407 [Favolaschia claudopus]|uniref:Uncharacterized protein n=1 Tax=Favolaschia claudopus TaxID=2862362 RepID=A0AAW0A8W8_9AGAR